MGTVTTLYMGVTDVMKSTLSVGVLYAFFALRGSFFTVMNTLIMSLLQLSVMRAHFGRLDDVLNEAPEPASEGVHIARSIRRSVALEGLAVQFAANESPLIDDVNLTIDIARHETIALIGPSGCGKSSLLRILASLHPVRRAGSSWTGAPSTRSASTSTGRISAASSPTISSSPGRWPRTSPSIRPT